MADSTTRFHVNPETGKTGTCGASVKDCPFGAEFHGSSLGEVEKAYERKIAQDDDPATNSFATMKKTGLVVEKTTPQDESKAQAEKKVASFLASDASKWNQVERMSKGARSLLLKAAANPYLAEQLKHEGKDFNWWAKKAFTQWTTTQGALGPMAPRGGYSQTGTNGFGVTESEIKSRLIKGQLDAEVQVALRGGKVSPSAKKQEKALKERLGGFPEELNFKENAALADDDTAEGEKYRTAASMVRFHEDFQQRVKAREKAGEKLPVLATIAEYEQARRDTKPEFTPDLDEPKSNEIMDLNYGQAMRVYLRAVSPDPDNSLYADVWEQLADRDQPPVGQQNIAEKISSIFRRG